MSDAKTWIGKSEPGDKLDLDYILKRLPPEAEWLINALNDTSISDLFVQRRAASDAANTAQQRFKIANLVAIIGTAVGTLASALLLYGAGADGGGTGGAAADPTVASMVNDQRLIIASFQIVGLFVAAAAAAILGSLNFIGQWTENRRQAESQRRDIFTMVLEGACQHVRGPLNPADPTNVIRLALEFFRRYQLDLQITFYRRAEASHGSRSGMLELAIAAFTAFAAVSGALAGLGGRGVVISAFLGIAVPILLSGAQSWRASYRDSDKAAAFVKARKALEQAHRDLSAVERAADGGDSAVVNAYFDRVHLIMASENETWVAAVNVAPNSRQGGSAPQETP